MEIVGYTHNYQSQFWVNMQWQILATSMWLKGMKERKSYRKEAYWLFWEENNHFW